jgi:hypothetical protein
VTGTPVSVAIILELELLNMSFDDANVLLARCFIRGASVVFQSPEGPLGPGGLVVNGAFKRSTSPKPLKTKVDLNLDCKPRPRPRPRPKPSRKCATTKETQTQRIVLADQSINRSSTQGLQQKNSGKDICVFHKRRVCFTSVEFLSGIELFLVSTRVCLNTIICSSSKICSSTRNASFNKIPSEQRAESEWYLLYLDGKNAMSLLEVCRQGSL